MGLSPGQSTISCHLIGTGSNGSEAGGSSPGWSFLDQPCEVGLAMLEGRSKQKGQHEPGLEPCMVFTHYPSLEHLNMACLN